MNAVVAELRALALAAARAASARQGRRRTLAQLRALHWVRWRDSYRAAANVLTQYDPRRARAVHLHDAAAFRVAAWSALASGDGVTAREMHRAAVRERRRAMSITVP